jgi:hypothetical protein
MQPRSRHFRIYCLAILFLGLAACCQERLPQNATVYISHPQVFTRERLVMSRQRDLQFLYQELDKPVSTGYQGAIDTRTLTALQNNFSATITPTPTTTTQPSGLNLVNQVLPAATTQATASNVTESSVDQFNDQMAFRDAVSAVIREKELDDTHDLYGRTIYTLKFDSALLPGDASNRPVIVLVNLSAATPADDKPFRQTYHDWVNYMDDRLRRDEAALSSRLVLLKLVPDDIDTVTHYLTEGANRFVQVQEQTQLLQKNPELDSSLKQFKSVVVGTAVQFLQKSPGDQMTMLKDPKMQLYVQVGFIFALAAKYEHDFAGLISVDYPESTNVGQGFATETIVKPFLKDTIHESLAPDGWTSTLSAFKIALKVPSGITQTLDESSLYVDSIDPADYSQNISDVSNTSNLLSLSLEISAIVGKAASLGDTLQYLKQSQILLQAIKRNPLAVGFRGNQQFGWLLGSPFQIGKNYEPTFIHQPARVSFAVAIVAPVWLTDASINASASWLDGGGKIQGNVSVTDAAHNIQLPTDLEAITTAIRYENTKRRPILDINPTEWTLQAGSADEQTLLILGTDLWRNPQVFVDSQMADRVDILSDMKGVLAHFKKVLPVHTPDNKAALTVVTSFGESHLDSAVAVLPPASNAISKLIAKIAAPYVVGGVSSQPLSFTIDPKSFPSSFTGFTLRLRLANGLAAWTQPLDTSGMTKSSDGTTLNFPIPALMDSSGKNPMFGNSPAMLDVDLRLQLTPFDDPINLLSQTDDSDRTVEYFPAKDQEKLALNTPSITFKSNAPTPANISVALAANTTRANIYQAFPGLQQSIKSNTAKLILQQTGNPTPVELTLAEGPGDTFATSTPLTPTSLPAATYDILKLQFVSPTGTSVSIPVLNSPLKVQ